MNNAFQDPFTAMAISFLVTLVCYGAFPILFAKFRESPIRDKRYTLICYAVNFAVAAGFIAVGSTGTAYVLWTFVFTRMGKSKLREKGILIDKENEQDFLKNETAAANADDQKKNEIISEVASPERNVDTNPQTISIDVAPIRKEKSENANVSAAKIKSVDQKCDIH